MKRQRCVRPYQCARPVLCRARVINRPVPRLISQILTSHAPCAKFLHKYSNREIMGSFLDIPAKEK